MITVMVMKGRDGRGDGRDEAKEEIGRGDGEIEMGRGEVGTCKGHGGDREEAVEKG